MHPHESSSRPEPSPHNARDLAAGRHGGAGPLPSALLSTRRERTTPNATKSRNTHSPATHPTPRPARPMAHAPARAATRASAASAPQHLANKRPCPSTGDSQYADVEASHAISRRNWTAREHAQGYPDPPGVRAARAKLSDGSTAFATPPASAPAKCGASTPGAASTAPPRHGQRDDTQNHDLMAARLEAKLLRAGVIIANTTGSQPPPAGARDRARGGGSPFQGPAVPPVHTTNDITTHARAHEGARSTKPALGHVSHLLVTWPDRQSDGIAAEGLVAAPAQAFARAPPDRAPRPPAYSSGMPVIDGVFHEVCAGNGTLTHCVAHHGLEAGTLSETDTLKAKALPLAFPKARVVGNAMTHDWRQNPALAVGGGTPCQPVAPSGRRLAMDDPRATVTVHALARAAALSGAHSADLENHADVLTVAGGSVFKEIVAVFAAHGFVLANVSVFCLTELGGPARRKRAAIRFEHERMARRLGPCPPLRPIRSPSLTIADVMLPLAQLPDHAFLPGTVTPRNPPTVLDDGVIIAADLKIVGARTALFVGSQVILRGETAPYVIEAFADDGSIYVFHDVRGKEHHRGPLPRSAVSTHLDQSHHVLSTLGKASAFTKMSVPPLCAGKQLWLRDGRAVVPRPVELFRLLELADTVPASFMRANPTAKPADTYGNAGDGISVRLAEPMAARLTTRLRMLSARVAFDNTDDDGSFERRAAAHFDAVDDGNTHVAFITADGTGALRVLVASDLVSLPRLCLDATGGAGRRSAVAASDALAGYLLPGERLCSFLVHDGDFRLTAVPLLHYTPTQPSTPFSRWATPADLAHTPLWRSAVFSCAHIATFMRADHGRLDKTLGRMVGTRGARALRPIATRPYAPSPEPALWPQQLHVLECVDTALRAALLATPRSDPHRDYLLEWVDQVDTSPNALVPLSLRGARHDFGNAKLVTTPFPDAAPSAKTEPVQFPRAQHTDYRPRQLTDILYPWAITRLAESLRDVVTDLSAWLKHPKRPHRVAKPRVIGQDGFVPDARGLLWDLENMASDERGPYFVPVDFTASTGTALNTTFLDTALEHSDDQALRSMLVHGFVFDFDVELQIVVLPHLLSLALGVDRGSKELDRLIGEGYFHAVEATAAHLARLDDGDVVIALGMLPCRMQAQGMVERKLEDRPRRTEDAGQPRKPLRDDKGVPVRPLNTITDPTRVVKGKRRLPREWKPTMRNVMSANAILQAAALVWQEPVVSFSDDFKDFFNQLYLHPSQRWLSTLIWLNSAAHGPAYSHVVELCLGFGCNVSSNYAQRFAHELVRLFYQRFDAEEQPLLDAELDPSRRAWIDARRKLSEVTGKNEARLYSLMCYTDDPHGMCVGVHRLVRMLRCWRGLTLAINARMAIAAKRQAGTSALWLGLRSLTTLGVVTVPDAKRTRATTVLRNIDNITMGKLKSLAGLLTHLRPFADDVAGIMYGFHPRESARLGPTDLAPPSPQRAAQAARWIAVLATRPGVSCLVALRLAPPCDTSAVYELSSDAAKDGTPTPGIAGHMHCFSWCVPLPPADVAGPLQIPIPVLELAAIVGNFFVFGELIPDGVDVVILSDSLTSVDALANESARAPLMQFLHLALTRHPQYTRLAPRTFVEHGYGETNVISDALSRGYADTLKAVCRQLNMSIEALEVPRSFGNLLDELRALNASLCAAPATTSDTRSTAQGPGVITGEASHPGPSASAPAAAPGRYPGPAEAPLHTPTTGAGQAPIAADRPPDGPETPSQRTVPPPRWRVRCIVPGCTRESSLSRGAFVRLLVCCVRCSQTDTRDHAPNCSRDFCPPAAQEADHPTVPPYHAEVWTDIDSDDDVFIDDGDDDHAAPAARAVLARPPATAAGRGPRHTPASPHPLGDLLGDLRAGNAASPKPAPWPQQLHALELLWSTPYTTDDTRSLAQGPGVLTGEASNPGPPGTAAGHGPRTDGGTGAPAAPAAPDRPQPAGNENQQHGELSLEDEDTRRIFETHLRRVARSQGGVCATQGCPRGARFLDRWMGNAYCCEWCFLANGREHSEWCLALYRATAPPTRATVTPPPERIAPAQQPPPAASLAVRFGRPPTPRPPPLTRPARAAWPPTAHDACRRPPVAPEEPDFTTTRTPSDQAAPARGIAPTAHLGRAHSPIARRPTSAACPPPASRQPTPTKVRRASARTTPDGTSAIRRRLTRSATRAGTKVAPPAGNSYSSQAGHAAPTGPAASTKPAPSAAAIPGGSLRDAAPATAPSNRSQAMYESLRADTSRLRLRTGNDALLRALIDDCDELIDDGRPASTKRKDESHWRKWCDFCALLGTSPWRDDPAANSGADADGHRRECFLQAAFMMHAHKNMKPRSRSDPAPKPASAKACVSSVRRVHALSGLVLPRAPAINRIIAGLCRRYVRAHGTAALIPSRKEPLKEEHLAAMYHVADGTPLRGSRRVRWASTYFISWRAFVNTTRTAGPRKADVLEMSTSSFTRGSMSRANLKWRIGGVVYADATRAQLASLAPGDAAVLIPGCSKADPFALHFGSSPMYLPYEHKDNNTNAAAALRDLELCVPVSGERRSLVPLFVSDDSLTALTHAQADATFDSLALIALGAKTANTLSLHSGRVFLASALKALKYDDADIQAFVRWRDPASIAIYAHREPDEYIAAISRALGADISSVLTKNLPTCDNDAEVARLQRTVLVDDPGDDAPPTEEERDAHAEQRARTTAPPTAAPGSAAPPLAGLSLAIPAASTRPPAPQHDPSFLASPGSFLARAEVEPGREVAVEFNAPHPTFFRGTVRRCRARNARVLFADGETLDVDYGLLRRVV